jgi:hypothetical protein
MQSREDFTEYILSNRQSLIEYDFWDAENQGTIKKTLFRQNHTLPIFRDGKVQISECGEDRISDRANGLTLVWGDAKFIAIFLYPV